MAASTQGKPVRAKRAGSAKHGTKKKLDAHQRHVLHEEHLKHLAALAAQAKAGG